jgi:DNA-binding protein HU-beta
MKKAELIDAMADAADISKAAAGKALDGLLEAIVVSLQRGEDVSLVGFGAFAVRPRAARTGRNPKTGETITIEASRVPSFKAGKALKDAVN